MAHHFAGPGRKSEGHLFEGNTRSRAQCQGSYGQAQRGMQPHSPHEEQQQRDGAGHTGQQVSIMGRNGRVHGPIIAAIPRSQAVDSLKLRPRIR